MCLSFVHAGAALNNSQQEGNSTKQGCILMSSLHTQHAVSLLPAAVRPAGHLYMTVALYYGAAASMAVEGCWRCTPHATDCHNPSRSQLDTSCRQHQCTRLQPCLVTPTRFVSDGNGHGAARVCLPLQVPPPAKVLSMAVLRRAKSSAQPAWG